MPWIRFHCCSLYRCLFRWEMALSCSPQTSSAVVLLWLWFLFLQVNLHQVLKPHGHGITLPISVMPGCSWDGDIVVSSSSTLLLGALDTLSGGLFTLVFLMMKFSGNHLIIVAYSLFSDFPGWRVRNPNPKGVIKSLFPQQRTISISWASPSYHAS